MGFGGDPAGRSRRVLRWDSRGWGRSSRVTERFNPIDDLAKLLDHLGVPRPHVVGLSAGGGLVLDFALTYPERVARLVMVAPAIGGWRWSESFQQRGGAFVGAVRSGRREALGEVLLADQWFAPGLRSRPEEQRRLIELVASNVRIFEIPDSLQQSIDPPAIGRLAELEPQTLVLLPELDHPDLHQIADTLRKSSPRVTLHRVPGAGHMVHLEQPARFSQLVAEFLSRR